MTTTRVVCDSLFVSSQQYIKVFWNADEIAT